MRIYFATHARQSTALPPNCSTKFPAARASLYRQFQNLRSRLSNSEFSVVDGRIFLQRPDSLNDPGLPLRLFRFMARHGLALSSTAEHQIDEHGESLAANPPQGLNSGTICRKSFSVPTLPMRCAPCIRSAFSLCFFLNLQGIDALVIRDYSHRLTVDEHSFVAIENLHELRQAHSSWDQRYAELT